MISIEIEMISIEIAMISIEICDIKGLNRSQFQMAGKIVPSLVGSLLSRGSVSKDITSIWIVVMKVFLSIFV